MARRRRRSRNRGQRGFLLIALIALLAMGGLYFLLGNLSPESMHAQSQQRTVQALGEAREALVGYAVRFRDEQLKTGTSGLVYGYLPLPDLGSSRNNNTGCTQEGCDAANFTGNALNVMAIGRFPWRALGTGPLRDGNGECLWYAVSGSHQRIQRGSPMNWDTLSHIDIVVADGSAAMVSAITSPHDRPIAVIFSPGPPLAGQNRGASATDTVTQCGGNYAVNNYLDPSAAADLAGITNYLAGSVNSASGNSSVANKPLSSAGTVNRRSDGTLVAGICPAGSAVGCAVVANDSGTTVTSELLFRTLRGSSHFRTDINAMLERMTNCLRDQIAAGVGVMPAALSGLTSPGDKSTGRIPDNACYDDMQHPLGYFSHYKDQVFVASKIAGDLTVTDTKSTADANDDTSATCQAALIFASQRGAKNPVPTDSGESLVQLRNGHPVSATNTVANTNWPPNYLEGNNLAGLITTGASNFIGPSVFAQVTAGHSASQDIVRCIPAGPSLTSVQSPALADAGLSQLAAYNPATRTVTLGALGVSSNNGAPAYALYGCTWTPETHVTGNGLRVYFRFSIIDRGDGFVFAMIDGDRNSANVCGAARQHLGYSGNNDPDQSTNGLLPGIVGNETAIIAYPKIGIEFDNTKATGTTTTAGDPLLAGRNDPDYTPPQDNDAHAAIVYWGDETAIATGTACNAAGQCPYTGGNCNTLGRCPAVRYCNLSDRMCYLRPEYDDNVHGFPVPPDASARPAPRNPPAVDPFPNPAYNPAPGLVTLDRLGSTLASSREFHVRVEVTRTYDGSSADAKDRKGTYKVETWIVAEGVDSRQIVAVSNTTRPMSEIYPGFAATLSNNGIRYDEPRDACVAGACPSGQTCASGTCYANGPPVIYDLPMGSCDARQKCSGPPLLKRNACAAGNTCPGGQSCGADNNCYDTLYSCGSDNICYGEAFRTMRLGFTNGQGTQDQVINISDFVTTWLP